MPGAGGQMLADPEELREAIAEGVEVHRRRSLSTAVPRTTAGSYRRCGSSDVRCFAFTAPRASQLDVVEGRPTTLATDSVVLATGQQSAPDAGVRRARCGRGGFVVTQPDGAT